MRPPWRAIVLSTTHGRLIAFAAAAIILVVVGWQLLARGPSPATDPTIGYRVDGLADVAFVTSGGIVATTGGQRANLWIGTIGRVEVEPGSRLRVENAVDDQHRLYLESGVVRARILAAPRAFQIGTPAGKTIDLGCDFELRVSSDGSTELRVTTGQVAFEFDGREVFVPATATCVARPGRGPSAPVFDTATAEFRAALARVEFAADPDPNDIAELVQNAELEDSLTLWHLFEARSSAAALRDIAFAQLARTIPRPEGVTDVGLLAGDPAMRRAWLESMKPHWRVYR